ncbi:ABC transporter substrate-binding protein [Pseudooceanicola pacificus]|uniref:ABC transporter substrate-binding protein n=1 Tax=Pseudooceanicola pacificus TaxID=2676438 RepID=UPI002E26BC02
MSARARLLRLAAALVLAGCTAPAALAQEVRESFGPADAPVRLSIRSTTDIAAFGPVIRAFLQRRPGLAVDYEQWGSNDLFDLSQTDCRGGGRAADAVISSGVQQMVKLVNDACAAPYRSTFTAALPDAQRWRDELWGISREPAVIVYNRTLVPPAEVPRTRFDLLDLLRPQATRYAGRVATYDIESSGLGYLFAFADAQEATTFGALMEALGRTGAVATCCSAEIIAGVAEGRYLLAYNVLGSYARAAAQADGRIGIVLPNDYTLVLSRALMIPRGAAHPGEAAEFLDFLLSPPGREALSQVLLVSPLTGKESGEDGAALSETALRPISLTPALIVALDRQARAAFIELWRKSFPAE